MSLLELKKLSKRFGGVKAVDDVSMLVEQGDIHAVIGPNGAGKSTLFKLISGEINSFQGNVILAGKNISRKSPHTINRLGVSRTFQITSVMPALKVLENIQAALFASTHRHFNAFLEAEHLLERESLELLDELGLGREEDVFAQGLSHGDQRILDFGIALASKPKLLLMDEPTQGMAPENKRRVMEIILSVVKQKGITIIFTEHDMDIVFSVAKRITVMHQGRVLAEGPPDEIKTNKLVKEIYLCE
jgi:branched-chain amino acid transport system ATP-binding protein